MGDVSGRMLEGCGSYKFKTMRRQSVNTFVRTRGSNELLRNINEFLTINDPVVQ